MPSDSDAERLALYYFAACPYCRMVLQVVEELGVEVELRDVLREPGYRQELTSALGRGTVPVLKREGDGGEPSWLPESRDIVRYLEERFG